MTDTDRIDKAARFLREKGIARADVGVVLGTGFGGFVRQLEKTAQISFDDIPHFAPATVEGHAGCMISARWDGADLLVMQGRLHRYEGYDTETIAFPLQVMHTLGVSVLVLTCAAGGLNPQFEVGDLMIVEDHLTGTLTPFPPFGKGRWPQAVYYNPALCHLFREAATTCGLSIKSGVLAWMPGPSLETRAEIAMLRRFGADAVTMSTAPEACIAAGIGMRTTAIACISNRCVGVDAPVDVSAVAAAVAAAGDRFSALLRGFISKCQGVSNHHGLV